MNILSANQKTKVSVNLPIPETCNPACPWFNRGCYGQKGRFRLSNIDRANKARHDLFMADPDLYFNKLYIEIIDSGLSHIRIFGIGDFPNKDYAIRLMELASKLPHVKFWIASFKAGLPAYKDILNSINALPNMICRVSYQSKHRRRHFEYTSAVVDDHASCPYVKGSNMNCARCGFVCWNKSEKLVTYKKH